MKYLTFRGFHTIQILVTQNYWNLALALTRSVLAFSLILNLLFNSNETLMIELQHLNFRQIEFYSVFQVFGNLNISRVFSLIILLIVLLGYYPRFTSVLHSWVAFSFMVSSKMLEGGDQVAHILSLLLVPILLFDKRKNHWDNKNSLNKNFYINTICFIFNHLIKIQFFVIYFFAATGKFASKEWSNGTAIYYWFCDSIFGLNPVMSKLLMPILKFPLIVVSITWLVLIIELAIAFSVFFHNKAYNKIIFIIAVLFHLSIGILFGLWSFFFAMLGILIYNLMNKSMIYGK